MAAREAIGLDDKLRMVLLAEQPDMSIRQVCEQFGVSRQTVNKWRRRYRTEGVEGLSERSRRPDRIPHQTPGWLEDEIVRLRKQLTEGGHDAGPLTISWHLQQQGMEAPSAATIHRILARRGQISPQPKKRPKAATVRFEWPQPNALWQIDATEWLLADDTKIWIIDCIDDHSRYVPAVRAVAAVTMQNAWQTMQTAISEVGTPARLLSDGGLAFTGRRHRTRVEFEDWTAQAGIRQIVSSPYHPQTCGKIERFHQTLKKWLRAQKPAPVTIRELQTQIDSFRGYYNHQRPHQGIGRTIPAHRYQATPKAQPETVSPQPSTRAGHRKVHPNGHVPWNGHLLGVGSKRADTTVTVIQTGTIVEVFAQQQLIGTAHLDADRRYQPLTSTAEQPKVSAMS